MVEGKKNHLENRFWGNRQTLIFRIDISDFWLLRWAIKSFLFSLCTMWSTRCELPAIHLPRPGEKSKLTPLAFKPADLRDILLEIRPLSRFIWLFKQFYSKKDIGVQILLLTVLGGRNCVFLSLVSLFYQALDFRRDCNVLVGSTLRWNKSLVVPFLLDHFGSPKSFLPPLGLGKVQVAQKLHRQENWGKLPGLYRWVQISL